MVLRRTPPAFKPEETNATAAMLPLVKNTSRQWTPGWCTYTDGFEHNPDVEVLCGGENEKRASAAACWRQGNLLHFGFEQSPDEMNETGQHLLLNCIAYISRFTEDRPIAVTPSVFGGPAALPRTYVDRRINFSDINLTELNGILGKAEFQAVQTLGRERARQWLAENRKFLHPGSDQKLEIDQEAKLLKAPIDRLEFFERAIAVLRTGGDQGQVAIRLLERYAPVKEAKRTSPAEWQQWLKENKPYLFFSDQADYRWYIDPLAKKRGVPSSELRGPARASKAN